jgi:hypothetical protein
MTSTNIALAGAVAAGLGAIAATVWVGAQVREETVVARPYEEGLRHGTGKSAAAACDLGAGPCTRALEGGGEVTLELSPRPLRTMRELVVSADLRGAASGEGSAVAVSFEMAGMEMGRNEARLEASGGGRHAGKAVLVRCPSGRSDWTAEVRVGGRGAPARTARFQLTVQE